MTATPLEATQTPTPDLQETFTPTPEDQETDNQIFDATLNELPSRFFVVQEGSPVGLPNWAHAEVGCQWLGVGGQVFNLQGDPELNLIIEAGGTLEGQDLIGLALTGLESVYGPGGYEIQLADHTVASQNEVWIQVKSGTGEKLSYPIYIQTFDDCNQNLVLLNLVEVEEPPVPPDPEEVYLPIIHNQSEDG